MPSLNYAVTGRATWTPEGWRTSEEAVMFINVQPAPRQHTSSNTINQPLTGDVHLSLLRVMEVSLWDNSAGEAGLAGPRLESVILRARWGQLGSCCLVAQQARLPAAAHGVCIQFAFGCGSDSVAPSALRTAVSPALIKGRTSSRLRSSLGLQFFSGFIHFLKQN